MRILSFNDRECEKILCGTVPLGFYHTQIDYKAPINVQTLYMER